MPPALKARILANMAKSKADITQVATPLIEADFVKLAEPAKVIQPIFTSNPSGQQPPPNSQFFRKDASDSLSFTSSFASASDGLSFTSTLPNDFDVGMYDFLGPQPLSNDASDNFSYTSTLPDVFDVGTDDLATPATRPWMVIDHFTGEIIVDEEALPPAPVVPSAPFDPVIQVEVVPALGIPTLVQTSSPTLLFVDQDEYPDWLIRSTKDHLQYMLYYLCLARVIDLFFTQEARLGYLDKVSNLR